MNYILFDDQRFRNQLKPLTLTRPLSELRVGIKTIHEKWEIYLNESISYLTESYLQAKYPAHYGDENIYLNASVCPNSELLSTILSLKSEGCLIQKNVILAIKTSKKLSFPIVNQDFTEKEYESKITIIQKLPDLFLNNGFQINADFQLITKNRQTAEITDPFTRVYAPQNVFVEEGASIKSAILNAENGSIYIGKNATIQEGAIIVGPFSADEGSIVAWGSKMRPNTTLGPHCRAGGEVGNSILMGYSNKAHDGFLGNSVIGQWCNLGANTNNSNLKNDYSEVKLYSYETKQLEKTGELFCGLFMGDYSKAGISTMFNTGTVVGVSANVFGSDFQEKHIPSFSWGGKSSGYETYRFDKAIQVINATMERRNKTLTAEEIEILDYIAKNY